MFVYKYYEVWEREEIDERQHQVKNKRERESIIRKKIWVYECEISLNENDDLLSQMNYKYKTVE